MCLSSYLFIQATIIFGILPLIHAQIMHIFTNKLVYSVSLKSIRSDLSGARRDLENNGADA
jgi:hypothetical protein